MWYLPWYPLDARSTPEVSPWGTGVAPGYHQGTLPGRTRPYQTLPDPPVVRTSRFPTLTALAARGGEDAKAFRRPRLSPIPKKHEP